MKEIKQEKLYQAGKVDQGFNPFKAADVTPYLRENQRTEQAQLRAMQDQQLSDTRLRQKSEKLALKTAQTEQNLKQYVADIEGAQQSRDMLQLSQFSGKLFNLVADVREERYKDRQAEIQVLFSEDEAARQEAELLQRAGEDQLSVLAAGDMALAQEAAKNDEPYSYVQRMRTLSGEDRYLYATAHAAKVGETFKSFAAQQMRENNGFITLNNGQTRIQINQPRDEAEASAVIGHLLKEHIKNNDAENLPPGLTATYIYNQTDKARASLLSDWSKDYAVNEGFKDRQLKFEEVKARILADPEDPNIIQDYLNTVSLTMNEAGTKRLRYPGAHDQLFDELLTLATGDSDDRELAQKILDRYNATTLNNRTFADIQSERSKDLRLKVLAYDKEKRKAELGAEKDKIDATLREMTIAITEGDGNFTQADVQPIIRFGIKAYDAIGLQFDPSKLEKLWAQSSLGGQALDDLRGLTATKFATGRVTEEDWDNLPLSLQKEFATKWNTLQTTRQGIFKQHKESIANTVLGDQYVNSAPKGARALGPLIVKDLQREFDQLVSNYMNDPDGDYREHEKAADRALKVIMDKFTTGVKDKGGRYFHDGRRGFTNYLEYGTDDRKLTTAFRERQDMVLQVAQNVGERAADSPELIGSREQILSMRGRVESGQGVDPFLRRSAQLMGMSWMELLNRQLDAQGDDKVETIEQIMAVQKQQTPELQRQLRGIQNGYWSRPQVDRLRGERSVRPAYDGLIASAPPRSRLIGAFETKESSGNPNAVNKDTGASGLIQVMPKNVPVWTQKYLGVRMTPAEYRADVGAQRRLANAYFEELVQKHTTPGRSQEEIIRRVAAEHYGGPGAVEHWNNPGYHSRSGPYNPGYEDNMQEYTQDVWNLYQGGK